MKKVNHYSLIMVDKVYKWMKSKVVPYGEIHHGKTLCGLSYPRRMVGGPMLV